jgi:ribonucleoside-diphosphate reductase alpha chain
MGTNPCVEIGMVSDQFCNLSIVNQTGIQTKEEFMSRVYSAALLGTLQASYTDFPYLSENWKKQTEKEALLGVSFTGIADSNNVVTADWLRQGAKLVLEVNEEYAKKIGINLAARATCVKPEGTSSCVLGSSSGIHNRKSRHYLRRVQINKDDPLYLYLLFTIPDLIEDAVGVPNTAVVTIPQESPEGAPTDDDSTALDLFNRVIKYNKNWVRPGHRSGANTHNVSCTINVRENEWDELLTAMWKEREHYTGISLFPFDNGIYEQAPFESCTKEVFDKYYAMVKDIDLTQVKEFDNNTKLIESVACAGGSCDVSFL